MRTYKPDTRIVIWTGRSGKTKDRPSPRFLYIGRENFIKEDQTVRWIYGYETPVEERMQHIARWLRANPANVTYSRGVDGTAAVSVSFVVGPKEQTGKRFMFRAKSRREAHDSWSMYLKEMLNKFVEPYRNYYENTDIFDEDYFKKPFDVQEPDFIFQPCQIMWVFARDRNGKWYKCFTSIIKNIVDNDIPGGSRTVTINGIAPIQMARTIPLFYKTYHQFGITKTLPDDPTLRDFYRTYLASVFTGLESPGLVSSLPNLTLSELLIKIIIAMNRRLGVITPEELNISLSECKKTSEAEKAIIQEVSKDIDKDALTGEFFGLGKITDEDKKEYLRTVQEYGMLKFKLFSAKFESIEKKDASKLKIEKYKGESLQVGKSEEEAKIGLVGIEELFEDVTVFSDWHTSRSAGTYQVNALSKIYLGNDFYDSEGKIPQIYSYLTQVALKYYEPINEPIMSLLTEIQNALQCNIYTDGAGNMILEYPQFNAFPTIKTFPYPFDSFFISKHNDHDERYILSKFNTTNFIFSTDTSNYISLLKFPIKVQLLNASEAVTGDPIYCGRSWASPAETLRFGLMEKSLQAVYVDPGKVFQSQKEFVRKIADSFRYRYNSGVYSGAATLKNRFDLQLGRNVLIPHKEMVYFITSENASITPGSTSTTQLTLACGHKLDQELPNPWNYFNKEIKVVDETDFDDESAGTQDDILDTTVCMTVDDVVAIVETKLNKKVSTSVATNLKEIVKNAYFNPKVIPEALTKPGRHQLCCDPKLAYQLALGLIEFKKWGVKNGFKDLDFRISSARRVVSSGSLSRHQYGRAADIAAVHYVTGWNDAPVEDGVIGFNANGSGYDKTLGDALADCFKSVGHTYDGTDSLGERGGAQKDYVLWNTPNIVGRYEGDGDYGHVKHLHVSIGRE